MYLKKIILCLIVLAIGLTTYGYLNQSFSSIDSTNSAERIAIGEMQYFVQSRPEKSASPTTLKNAKSIADVIAYYPGTLTVSYDSVVVVTTSNGRQQKAIGESENLTAEQKAILATADMFSNVVFFIKHKSKNSVTGELENGEMLVKLMVRPETEAVFNGGMDGLIDYLKENSEEQVKQLAVKQGFVAVVNFTINEEGNADEIEVAESSEYLGIDEVLKQLLKNMPSWTPAQDAIGNKVPHEFEIIFGFGTEGGC
ncbi:MAG: TonB family protein [Bacteroidia bacterium]|jgi:TonB family protein